MLLSFLPEGGARYLEPEDPPPFLGGLPPEKLLLFSGRLPENLLEGLLEEKRLTINHLS